MTTQIFENTCDAIAATTIGDGRNFYGLGGKVILAPTMTDARNALTEGLRRLSQGDLNAAMRDELRKNREAAEKDTE